MSTHAASASRPQLRADHGIERSAHAYDLGHEPPLDPAGGAAEVDRRGVSLRWLGASVLTGVTGAALIGAAIYVSHDGEMTFAAVAERAVPGLVRSPSGDDRGLNTARKGDKLVRSEVIALAKQSFRAPMTVRNREREAIRVRPFVRIATNLSLTSGAYAADIPPFNPLRLFAEAEGERFAEPPAAAGDADVSVVKRDLSSLLAEINGPALSDGDVLAQIEEERRLANDVGRSTGAAVVMPAQLMLSRILSPPAGLADPLGENRPLDAPFSSIEVRVVPENVTTLAKVEPRGSEPLFEERDVPVRKGEPIEVALRASGANPDQIQGIVAALGRAKIAALAEGQQLRILLGPGARPGDGRQVVRVTLYGERGIEGIAAVNDRGLFVSVAPPTDENAARVASRPAGGEDEEEDDGGGVRLYNSLYETALKHDLPRQTVEELIRVFGYDVDFQRRVSAGDNFELFYTFDEDGGSDRPEILYAALTLGGEAKRVFRFQSPDDGSVEYFDEVGRSLKKFLIRKPIADGQLRSGFGYRRHPILGYSKMHTGVDWANRIGTPIMAAGNGTVIKAEWDSGYGRRIEVQHANGYVTAYSHQSAFARGIAPGARVRQGQLIGYVGSTGLSTGPHLHYEVIVNGHFVDPMKIRVPRGRELDGRLLADFKRQREQVETLLQRAGGQNRFAQRDARADSTR